MKLKGNNISVTIDDNSEIAKKIKQGYNFTIDKNGKINIEKISNKIKNKYQAIIGLKKAKTVDELKNVLIEFLDNLEINNTP